MICVINKTGADGNTYEKITGEAETLDILTFVKEHMENGSVILLKIFLAHGDASRCWLISCRNFTIKQTLRGAFKEGQGKKACC